MIQHFVFGYGSLLCQQSRAVTLVESMVQPVLPVLAQNVQRIWAKRSVRGMTSLGVRLLDESKSFSTDASSNKQWSCVGAIVPVWGQQELERLDEREHGYRRVPLTLDQIQTVPYLSHNKYYKFNNNQGNDYAQRTDDSDSSDDEFWLEDWLEQATRQSRVQHETTPTPCIWTYAPLQEQWPDPDYPIAQSYVDTILRGCLSYSNEMAHDFIQSTVGWSCATSSGRDSDKDIYISSDDDASGSSSSNSGPCWVNDRHAPIYPRGDLDWNQRHSKTLDALLEQHLPQELARRELLPGQAKQ